MRAPTQMTALGRSRGDLRALVLTLLWLIGGTVFLRWWDVTIRLERLPLWTAVFTGLYAARLLAPGGRRPAAVEPQPDAPHTTPEPWSDVWLWLGIVIVAATVTVIFPAVVIGSSRIQTVALLRVIEVVVPLWILFRGVGSEWSGASRWFAAAGTTAYLLLAVWFITVRMPGESYEGELPPLTAEEQQLRDRLERHVTVLAEDIGARGFRGSEQQAEALAYILTELRAAGYTPEEQIFVVRDREYVNVQVTLPGADRASEIVVVGAHYDTYDLTPGADDNASGTAGALELARLLAGSFPVRTLRLVFFANEEPPFFNTPDMGSRVYAARAAEAGEDIVAMFSLETIGYFRDEPGTQRYPPPFSLFYPDRGDFVGFIGNPASGRLVRRALTVFRETTAFPSEGAAVSSMTPGAELSDHASFWREGYEALMITDTAPFRNDNYHTSGDTVETLDFDRMARVVAGARRVVEAEAGIR